MQTCKRLSLTSFGISYTEMTTNLRTGKNGWKILQTQMMLIIIKQKMLTPIRATFSSSNVGLYKLLLHKGLAAAFNPTLTEVGAWFNLTQMALLQPPTIWTTQDSQTSLQFHMLSLKAVTLQRHQLSFHQTMYRLKSSTVQWVSKAYSNVISSSLSPMLISLPTVMVIQLKKLMVILDSTQTPWML